VDLQVQLGVHGVLLHIIGSWRVATEHPGGRVTPARMMEQLNLIHTPSIPPTGGHLRGFEANTG